MPTNPSSPNTNATVDRLSLSIDPARGSDAVTSGPFPCGSLCGCFDAEASSLLCGVGHCACFEGE